MVFLANRFNPSSTASGAHVPGIPFSTPDNMECLHPGNFEADFEAECGHLQDLADFPVAIGDPAKPMNGEFNRDKGALSGERK